MASYESTSRWARRLARQALAGAAIGALLCGGLAAHMALAAIGACGSDPVVLLSNGTELEFSTTIDDAAPDVRQLRYTLHIPTGTQIIGYIAGALGTQEQWSTIADMPAGTYETVTRVSTSTPGITVRTTMQALGLIGIGLASVAGQDDQDLVVRLTI